MTSRSVRLRHPKTGGEFDAPPPSVRTYAMSGWEIAPEPEADPAPSLPAAPAPGTKPASTRRRRAHTEES